VFLPFSLFIIDIWLAFKATAALLAEVVTLVFKSVINTDCAVTVEAKISHEFSLTLYSPFLKLFFSNIAWSLDIFKQYLFTFLSYIYKINLRKLIPLLLNNLTSHTYLSFKRVWSLIIWPKLDPAVLQIL